MLLKYLTALVAVLFVCDAVPTPTNSKGKVPYLILSFLVVFISFSVMWSISLFIVLSLESQGLALRL